jgi:hypothetical protein
VVAQRYDNPKPKFARTPEAEQFAQELVDLYFDECKNQDIDMKALGDEDAVNDITRKFFNDIAQKHYPQQYRGMDCPDTSTIRFHLKNIFKPIGTMKEYDAYKAGQGISAWHTNLNSMFCLAWRLICCVDIASDRDDKNASILTDNGLSEEHWVKLYNDRIGNIKNLMIRHGICDAIMFDSNQNWFTQYIEKLYWLRLGVSATFLNHYYAFRTDMKLQGSGFQSIMKDEKASGEPNTLRNNGLVMKVLGNAILRGEGPRVDASKGDDYDKAQQNLAVDVEMQTKIEEYCPLKLKVKISDVGEFCGYTISTEGLTPNLLRRVYKISGKRWRDYKHFAEEQKSLRNYIDVVNSIGVNKCIGNTMLNERCNESTATTAYYVIDSWSHINEEQWRSVVKERLEAALIPIPDDYSEMGVRLVPIDE